MWPRGSECARESARRRAWSWCPRQVALQLHKLHAGCVSTCTNPHCCHTTTSIDMDSCSKQHTQDSNCMQLGTQCLRAPGRRVRRLHAHTTACTSTIRSSGQALHAYTACLQILHTWGRRPAPALRPACGCTVCAGSGCPGCVCVPAPDGDAHAAAGWGKGQQGQGRV